MHDNKIIFKIILLVSFIIFQFSISACNSKENDTDNPNSFIKQYNIKGADNKMRQHPRLLFSINDVPSFREKVKDGWLKNVYDEMARYADTLLNSNIEVPVSAAFGRRLCKWINNLALTGYIKDDKRYIDKAIDLLMYQVEKYEVEDFNKMNSDLAVGDGAQAYAVGYDWLEPFMTDQQKELVRQEVEKFGVYLANLSDTKYKFAGDVSDSCNWNAVVNGGLGLCSLVLDDKDSWLESATRQVEKYFKHSTDATGYNYEGVGYFNYGTLGGVTFAAALARAGGSDLVSDQPKMKLASEFILRLMLPWGKDLATLGDSDQSLGSASGLMYIISKLKDETGLWTWLQLLGENGDKTYGHSRTASDADGCSLPYTIIWADPKLKPVTAAKAELSLNKVFESGRVSMRDGWDPMDSLVIYNSGFTKHSGHNQRDGNSFTFFALGEEFCIDPGYGPWLEIDHSLLMADEVRNERVASEYIYSTKLVETKNFTDAFYVKGDASNSQVYFPPASKQKTPLEKGIKSAVRQLLFVHSPSGVKQPYILIIDDIKKTEGSQLSNYSWLLQTAKQNKIEIDPAKCNAKIIGSKYGAILNIDFLYQSDLNIKEINFQNIMLLDKSNGSTYNPGKYHKTFSAQVIAKDVRIVALLTATEKDIDKPSVEYTGTAYDGQLMIKFSDGTADTINISVDNMDFLRTNK